MICGVPEVCLLFPILLSFHSKLVVEIDDKQIGWRSDSNRDWLDDLLRTDAKHQGGEPLNNNL